MRHFIAAIFLILFFPVIASAEVRAFVDKTEVGAGESIQLTVSISGSSVDASVDTSRIQDFSVIPLGTSQNFQVINGKVSAEVIHHYTLVPLKTGTLKVPPLIVQVNGETYKTHEIIINSSDAPLKGSDAPPKEAETRDIIITADISNNNPYESEQIIYTFKLCRAVQTANTRFQAPDFSGFTTKEIKERKSYRKIINGREYDITEVSFILIPIGTGEKTIQPSVLTCDIVYRDKRNVFDSIFNDSFFGRSRLETKVYRTQPVTINIKPLPAYDGDSVFSGLVGKFEIKAVIESNTLKVRDSTTLSIIITGTGNIMDAEEPEIVIHEAFKVYKDAPQEEININNKGFFGKKIFRMAIVPLKDGKYDISSVRLSYFDTYSGQYETISTQPISVMVQASSEKEQLQVFSSPSPENGSVKQKVDFTGRDIFGLKDDIDALKSLRMLSIGGFILFLIAPALCFIITKAVIALTNKSDTPEMIMANRSKTALKLAAGSSGEEFFSYLYRALVSAILSKAKIIGESLTYAEAKQRLCENGCSEDMAKTTAELLEKIESARFGGADINDELKHALFSETKKIVGSLIR